jgi:hypothetical protein
MPPAPSGTIKLPFEKLNSILTNGIARGRKNFANPTSNDFKFRASVRNIDFKILVCMGYFNNQFNGAAVIAGLSSERDWNNPAPSQSR